MGWMVKYMVSGWLDGWKQSKRVDGLLDTG